MFDMAENNGRHGVSISRGIPRPSRVIYFIIIVQVLHYPTILVESLPIKQKTTVPSFLSSLRSSPYPFTVSSRFPTTCSPCKTINVFGPILPIPLYSSTDDTSEFLKPNNETTERFDHDSETLANNRCEDATTEINNKGVTSGVGSLPSYQQLLVFTVTTILIWLSEPLLSLVDTTIVGLTASANSAVIQIAALGPATTLFDSLVYTTYFLAISTTNQLAPGLATAASTSAAVVHKRRNEPRSESNSGNATNPWKELRRSTSHLLGLAIAFGSLVSAITFVFGKTIIAQMVGGATNMGVAEANSIIPLATNYARIRAIVAPFSIVGFVAQSFCLTTLDVATPAIAVAAASVVNILGDLALSPRFGIQGAAIATALATVTSCFILLRKVSKTTNQWKTNQFELETATLTNEASATETMIAADSFENLSIDTETKNETNSKHLEIPFCSIPDKASMINLFKLAGPIFFVMISKVACYNLMTVRATTFGITPLASHNIMMRVFFFFACFGDSLSQAAQSFVPQIDRNARRSLIQRLFCIASFIGLSINLMSRQILSRFGRFLTKDSNIIALMAEYSPLVGLALFLHPFIMLLEGTILARRDLIFMVGSYICTSILHFGFVFSPVASSFAGLWRALFVFQNIRLVQFAFRVWYRSRSSHKRIHFAGVSNQDVASAPPL